MVAFKKAVLPAFASLALVLTVFACGDGGGSSSGGDIGEVSSSSVIGGQSSSSIAQRVPSKGSFADSRDGQTYEYVKIGDQTWMAENLNYNASGSKCYDNLTSNCDIYGRLYDWATAKIACPAGWHLPSDTEWTVLTNYVGGSSTAGTKLKAANGWSGNGTDDYGFSALPGGHGHSNGSFDDDGYYGGWWTASESRSSSTYYAYRRYMRYDGEGVDWNGYHKSHLYSVRCVRD